MAVYRIFHQGMPKDIVTTESTNIYAPDTVYVPQYKITKVGHHQITIDVYGILNQPYKVILDTIENYLAKGVDAEITIIFTLGQISQIFIQVTRLSPRTVGHQIVPTEIYSQVADIVHKYHPEFQYQQFVNGFLVRLLGFVKTAYLNDMYNDLILLYRNNYEVWITFGNYHGAVISFNRILGEPLPKVIPPPLTVNN